MNCSACVCAWVCACVSIYVCVSVCGGLLERAEQARRADVNGRYWDIYLAKSLATTCFKSAQRSKSLSTMTRAKQSTRMFFSLKYRQWEEDCVCVCMCVCIHVCQLWAWHSAGWQSPLSGESRATKWNMVIRREIHDWSQEQTTQIERSDYLFVRSSPKWNKNMFDNVPSQKTKSKQGRTVF